MTDIGDNGMNENVHNFQATIPDGATGILFTAGENGPQTTDITDLNHEGWWLNDDNDNGKFIGVCTSGRRRFFAPKVKIFKKFPQNTLL